MVGWTYSTSNTDWSHYYSGDSHERTQAWSTHKANASIPSHGQQFCPIRVPSETSNWFSLSPSSSFLFLLPSAALLFWPCGLQREGKRWNEEESNVDRENERRKERIVQSLQGEREREISFFYAIDTEFTLDNCFDIRVCEESDFFFA